MKQYLNKSLLIGMVLGGLAALPLGFGLGVYYLPILAPATGPAMRRWRRRNPRR
jgi:hypothetical protein